MGPTCRSDNGPYQKAVICVQRSAGISSSFISAAPPRPQLAAEKLYNKHAMADSDQDVAAADGHGVLEGPAAATGASAAGSDEEDFTFAVAAVPRVAAGDGVFADGGRIGAVYPLFGRPRSPPLQEEEEEEEDPGTATVRVPLGQLLLEERASSPSELPDDDDLDGVPAETYCLWSPGSPAVGSPVRCQKSGSTGSVLRWRQRLIGRSHSDGKEKFVFLNSSSDSKGRTGGSGGARGWSYYGRGGGGRRSSFLPYKQDLVGLFANAGAFRRSYHPF